MICDTVVDPGMFGWPGGHVMRYHLRAVYWYILCCGRSGAVDGSFTVCFGHIFHVTIL